jgi:hypothetical protein
VHRERNWIEIFFAAFCICILIHFQCILSAARPTHGPTHIVCGFGKQLEKYLNGHPGAVYSPGGIQAGQLVVSVTGRVEVCAPGPQLYAWLWDRFEAAEVAAHSYLIYNISQSDIDRLYETKSIYGSQYGVENLRPL